MAKRSFVVGSSPLAKNARAVNAVVSKASKKEENCCNLGGLGSWIFGI